MLRISIKQGNIIEEKTDAIVNPANSYGLMNGGVSSSIKKVGGEIIEVDAVRNAPIDVGEAIITTAGMLFARHIIHSPTMIHPSSKATEDSIKKSVRAALRIADENKLSKISMPGMGTGIGEFEPIDAAKIMIDEIKEFKPRYLKEVVLIDIGEMMVKAFKDELNDAK